MITIEMVQTEIEREEKRRGPSKAERERDNDINKTVKKYRQYHHALVHLLQSQVRH